MQGFSLSFHFKSNPYFDNELLTKTYELGEEEDMLENVQGCEIKWKPGKNLTVKTISKKKGKGAFVSPLLRPQPCLIAQVARPRWSRRRSPPKAFSDSSPLHSPKKTKTWRTRQEFFDPHNPLIVLLGIQEEMTLGDLVEADFQLGTILKQVVATAVDWYDGSAMERLLAGEDDDEDEDEEGEEEEEEGEDDDDSEEDEKDNANSKAARGAAGGSKVDPATAGECKQQ